MRNLRTLSTRSLLALTAAFVAVAVGGAAIAVAARGGSQQTPPPKPLAQAIHDAVTAPEPAGITARISFTNKLFPSGAFLGNAGSALMSGATGRLWLTKDAGRLELQSDAGDAQIVWNANGAFVYDASSNTVYKFSFPASTSSTKPDNGTPPSLAQITDFLNQLAEHASVSGAQPSNVAGEPAYTVSVAPKHDGGLLGRAELAWDAAKGVPLRAAIYAQGSASPVLELKATQVSYGAVAASDVDVSPPAGAKVVDLGAGAKDAQPSADGKKPVTGIDAVKAGAGFPVVAPDALVGLPRKSATLVGGSDHEAALLVYGQGLGAVVVLERTADATGKQSGSPLASLPRVSLDGATAHELATQLGTALEWQRGGVDYVVAGSLPPAAAEAAARDLR